jgi:hypothetical protein
MFLLAWHESMSVFGVPVSVFYTRRQLGDCSKSSTKCTFDIGTTQNYCVKVYVSIIYKYMYTLRP